MNVVRKSDPVLMPRQDFLAWAAAQPSGKYERIDGIAFAMAPETVAHAARKSRISFAMQSSVERAGLPCEVLIDGPSVAVGENDFVPDVILRCGPAIADGMTVPDPLVLVEVQSPSTQVTDLTIKLKAYFQIPSVMHYLIVWVDQRRVQHHARSDAGIVSTLITTGDITLDPPGISFAIEKIY
jgi:Uma2 family endonuclease